jgi:hypothetical protein
MSPSPPGAVYAHTAILHVHFAYFTPVFSSFHSLKAKVAGAAARPALPALFHINDKERRKDNARVATARLGQAELS